MYVLQVTCIVYVEKEKANVMFEVECEVFGVGCVDVCDACDCKIMKVE